MKVKVVLNKKFYKNGRCDILLEIQFDPDHCHYSMEYKEQLDTLLNCLRKEGHEVEYIEKIKPADNLFT